MVVGSFGPGSRSQPNNYREYPSPWSYLFVCYHGSATQPAVAKTHSKLLYSPSTLLMPLIFFLDGTLVNTVIAGSRFGVAKNAMINCIKVSKDIGAKADTSDFISGIDLALGRARKDPRHLPSVIVAAWESQLNRPLDAAVRMFPLQQ